MQKSSVDEIEKRGSPSYHVSSHRSYEQLHLDMMGPHLPKGRDVKGLLRAMWHFFLLHAKEGETSSGIIAHFTCRCQMAGPWVTK